MYDPKLCCLIDRTTKAKQKITNNNIEMQTEDKPYSGVQCNLSFKMANDQHDGKMSHSCNQCILFANSATTPAHKLVTSRNTC